MLLVKTVLNNKIHSLNTLEILEIQTTSNTSDLKRFLGMALFSRKIIDNFSSKASM